MSARRTVSPSSWFTGGGEDRDRRRRVRAEASDLQQRLGYTVELEPKRNVYDLAPRRPVIEAYG